MGEIHIGGDGGAEVSHHNDEAGPPGKWRAVLEIMR